MAARAKKKPSASFWTGGAYQTTMFGALDPDEPLAPNVVTVGDPRWSGCLAELRRLLKEENPGRKAIGIDTEFYGPWKSRKEIDYWEARIRLVQVGLPSRRVMVFDLGGLLDDRDRCRENHDPALEVLRRVVEDPTIRKVGQTLLTEYLLFRIWFGWKMRCMRDVMLISQVVWAGVASKQFRWVGPGEGHMVHQETLRHSLKAICDRLGIEVDKTEQVSDWAGRLTNRQLNYAARDVLHPLDAFRKLGAMAKDDGILNSVTAECEAQPAFCECEFNGQPVDEPLLRQDLATWDRVREETLAPFRKRFPSTNPGSPDQVSLALTDALDVRVCSSCGEVHDPVAVHEARRREGKPDDAFACDWKECRECGSPPSQLAKQFREDRTFWAETKDARGRNRRSARTSDAALAAVQEIPYVRALLEWKSMTVQRNWLQAVLDNLRGGRIRGDYQQIVGGADHRSGEDKNGRGMGRSSCGRPVNLQNPSNLQPSHEKAGCPSVRRAIKAPTPGSITSLREAARRLRRSPNPADRESAGRMEDVAEHLTVCLEGRSRAFIVADLSQAHARIACQVSQDPVLLRDFRAGVDFHLAMAHRLVLQGMDKFREEARTALARAEAALKKATPENLESARKADSQARKFAEALASTPSFEDVVRLYKDDASPLKKLIKQLRKTAKPVNYGSLNLQGPATLKETGETSPEPVYFTLEEAAAMRDTWRALYAGLWRFQKAVIKKANSFRNVFPHIGVDGEYGEVRALTGRRLFLIKEWQPKHKAYSVKGTDCVSAVWMMTEADAIKRAMGWLIADFDAHPEWGAIFTNMAHDEINVECWAEYAEDVARQVQARFHQAMRWAGVTDIPVDEAGADYRKMIVESWASK